MPRSLRWDAMHAIVTAAHRTGRTLRDMVVHQLTACVQQSRLPSPDDAHSGTVTAAAASEDNAVYAQLFAALFTYMDRCVAASMTTSTTALTAETRKDVSAMVYLMVSMKASLQQRIAHVPTQPLLALMDIWRSMRDGRSLPQVSDSVATARAADAQTTVQLECIFGESDGNVIKVGKIVSSRAVVLAGSTKHAANALSSPRAGGGHADDDDDADEANYDAGRFYFEVTLPIRTSAPFAIGWGTEQHKSVPGQHVGSDRHSFAFNGNDVVSKEMKEEYKISADISPGCVVGALFDATEKLVAWSINGVIGPWLSVPLNLRDSPLFAYASIGTCSGMHVRVRADGFEYAPDNYTDLAGHYTRVLVDHYAAHARSEMEVQSVTFYTQLASYLSDVEESREDRLLQSSTTTATSSMSQGSLTSSGGSPAAAAAAARVPHTSSTTTSPPGGSRTSPHSRLVDGGGAAAAGRGGASALSPTFSLSSAALDRSTTGANIMRFLLRYPALVSLPPTRLNRYARVIAVIESCMASARRFVDLDSDTVSGDLSIAFVHMKPFVRRSFRQKLLVNIPAVEKVTPATTISIRVTELYSTLPRSTDVALQHTILSQLYKQIGLFTSMQWSQTPLFKVHLYISDSGHTPIDMGGPYRQVWTFLAEEMMNHPDKCYPHSDFHRNPLFSFINNSQRVSLVPDHLANSSYELTLYSFFGKIMGHAARAKFPLDIDFSPFLWKYLVDDVLTIQDYYQHVDSVVEKSMEDNSFLLSGLAEDIIPGFAERTTWIEEDEDIDEDTVAQHRRAVAESCLVHSMDEQLSAIRMGLWTVLPRRIVRCLAWRDLERLVCGETDPSIAELKKYIRPQLQLTRERYFWQIVEEMTGEQKASLLCFASGQRRLPLIRPISITENNESTEHLPRAQSCSSLITIPPYTSLEMFREKLLMALQHQMEMELA